MFMQSRKCSSYVAFGQVSDTFHHKLGVPFTVLVPLLLRARILVIVEEAHPIRFLERDIPYRLRLQHGYSPQLLDF